jgi:hypothetical protein
MLWDRKDQRRRRVERIEANRELVVLGRTATRVNTKAIRFSPIHERKSRHWTVDFGLLATTGILSGVVVLMIDHNVLARNSSPPNPPAVVAKPAAACPVASKHSSVYHYHNHLRHHSRLKIAVEH